MTVRRHATKGLKNFSFGISYSFRQTDERYLLDARNVYDNKGITETRHGIRRYNSTSLGGSILSQSFFKKSDGTTYRLAKVGTTLYKVASSGAHTAIKTGLSSSTKHKAVTLTDRHIIAIEGDGLFSYNGTIFTQLGQAAPTGVTASTLTAGGSLLNANSYAVGITFYASTIGFESNAQMLTAIGITNPNKQIDLANIPTTAANALIDTVRIYLKNETTASAYQFVTDLALGTTTYSITAPSTSTISPPIKNAPPISGGGKYITLFGKKIAYAGNSTFKSEVFISEDYLPDAFDGTTSQVVLQIPGQGPITGIAQGLFNDKYIDPYLAIFKQNSISIYSELNGIPRLVTIDTAIGCVSNDTIIIKNGNIYFMSLNGWYVIYNGSLVKDQNGVPQSLGQGKIDDIFSRVGWTFELNLPQSGSFFSSYYLQDSVYMTFISEGANTAINKCYTYEERIGGFRAFQFKTNLVSACESEDDSGYGCVFIGDDTGTIFYYSARNSRHDEDNAGASISIPCWVQMPWIMPGEDANSYNFRTLTVRALASASSVIVKAAASFGIQLMETLNYDFSDAGIGFVLDVSQLDVNILGDDRTPVQYMADLNLTGIVLFLSFYQDAIDNNIALISAQLSLNKRGNNNV